MPLLKLQIDRLVLHGFSPLQAQRVRDAFTAALADARPDDGLLASPTARQRDTLRLAVRDDGSPEALGRAAARALLEQGLA